LLLQCDLILRQLLFLGEDRLGRLAVSLDNPRLGRGRGATVISPDFWRRSTEDRSAAAAWSRVLRCASRPERAASRCFSSSWIWRRNAPSCTAITSRPVCAGAAVPVLPAYSA
jgi:hypothetical protein